MTTRDHPGTATVRRSPKREKFKASEATAPRTELERALGFRFRNPALLELALTHRSFAYETRAQGAHDGAPSGKDQKNEPGSDNEQLEFLGDAVLGLVVTEALYRHFPHCSEGEMTRLRASLVSRQRMARMGEDLRLSEFLKLGKSAEANGGRRKPALLANAAEAVLAAIYLDSIEATGGGLAAVRKLTDRLLLKPELPGLQAALQDDAGRGALRDSKTLLQERVQAESSGRLRYVDVDQTGPAHQRRFGVEVHLEQASGTLVLAAAEGSSKKEAQQRAAARALADWHPERITEKAPRREPTASGSSGSKAAPSPAESGERSAAPTEGAA